MSIETARHNFDLMKRTASYEFAKTRNEFETSTSQAQVDAVVGQVAKRLDTTPEIARTILAQDGWKSKFEASRPAGEKHAQTSTSAGAAANFGASASVAGNTAQRLGGFRDWQPDANAFVAKLEKNDEAMMQIFSLAGAGMSNRVGDLRAEKDGDGFKVTADICNFMTGAVERELKLHVSADMKSIDVLREPAKPARPTTPPTTTTPSKPAVEPQWARAATAEESAFASTLQTNQAVMGALFQAGGAGMSQRIGDVDARKVGDGWDVHGDVCNFMSGVKEGVASVKLDDAGAVV